MAQFAEPHDRTTLYKIAVAIVYIVQIVDLAFLAVSTAASQASAAEAAAERQLRRAKGTQRGPGLYQALT